MTVSELLTASRTAHTRYRKIHNDSKNTDAAGMHAALSEAYQRRKEATDIDPLYSDPAWRADAATAYHVHANVGIENDTLMQFYLEMLAR